jgi:hypothetical protein
MTNNFRRFNARIGIVFVFQNQLMRLYRWKVPTQTLSILALYIFACLDPYLLIIIPVAVLLLSIMVPAFLTRHPLPPPSAYTATNTPYYSIKGPALAPPRTIKPVSETSKDFFRNMRDLQNSMADFSALHDALIAVIAPLTNFSNEIFSSVLFLYLWILMALLFIAAHLFPWRCIFLAGGIIFTCSGHPIAQSWLPIIEKKAKDKAEFLKARSKEASVESSSCLTMLGIVVPTTLPGLRSAFSNFSAISLDTAPQIREVEIFELQHRPLSSNLSEEWKPFLFTPTPYDPLSPVRISGNRPKGTRFFEDIQPPKGWTWEGKKWELDLEAREWVSDRLVTGVEFDILYDGGPADAEFGGWVWDLPELDSPAVEEESWLAYDYGELSGKRGVGDSGNSSRTRSVQAWEENTAQAGRAGPWRRRRWARLVKRVVEGGDSGPEQETRATPKKRR